MLPSQAAAALLWTLTASPLTATTGVSTAFTLVGTNGDLLSDIGCIRVTVPNASVHGASIIAVSNGRTWLTSVSGNTVWVQSQDGGGRLALLQSVTFRIQATPSAPGAFAWNANAYSQQDCAGTGSLLGVPPVVVVSGPAVTPSPTPTPTASPTPTSTPTPQPTRTPTPEPSFPLPSLPVPSLPLPTLPLPTPSASSSPEPSAPLPSLPIASATPTPSPGASQPALSSTPSPTSGSGGSGGSQDGGNPAGGGAVAAPVGPGGVGVRTTPTGSDGLTVAGLGLGGLQLWLVPGAVIAGPGLLVLIWLAIQVVAGMVWLPAARRIRGENERRPDGTPRPQPMGVLKSQASSRFRTSARK